MDDTQRNIVSTIFLKLVIISLIINSLFNVMNTRIIISEKLMKKIELDL